VNDVVPQPAHQQELDTQLLQHGRVGDIRWELVRSFRFFLSGVVVYLTGSC
jgi:hypothetical protein